MALFLPPAEAHVGSIVLLRRRCFISINESDILRVIFETPLKHSREVLPRIDVRPWRFQIE